MRIYSTQASGITGEVTVLAIVETVAAICLVFYLYPYYNTLGWLALAMLIAPLLMLRTDQSVELGIKYWDNGFRESPPHLDYGRLETSNAKRLIDIPGEIDERAKPSRETRSWPSRSWILESEGLKGDLLALLIAVFSAGGILSLFVFWGIVAALAVAGFTLLGLILPSILLGLLAFAVRVSSVAVSFVRDPWAAIRAIPRNWARVALATDLFSPAEVIPGHEVLGSFNPFSYLRALIADWKDFVFPSYFAFTLMLVWYLPSVVYRLSLKATSIIYAPLIFLVYRTFSDKRSLRSDLEIRTSGPISVGGIVLSLAIVLGFIVKLVIQVKMVGFVEWWYGSPVREVLALYVAPAEIPRWQLVSFVNSILTIGVFTFAKQALIRERFGDPWSEKVVRRILNFSTALGFLFTMYTVLCTGYITWKAGSEWNWPPLGEEWFPW